MINGLYNYFFALVQKSNIITLEESSSVFYEVRWKRSSVVSLEIKGTHLGLIGRYFFKNWIGLCVLWDSKKFNNKKVFFSWGEGMTLQILYNKKFPGHRGNKSVQFWKKSIQSWKKSVQFWKKILSFWSSTKTVHMIRWTRWTV